MYVSWSLSCHICKRTCVLGPTPAIFDGQIEKVWARSQKIHLNARSNVVSWHSEFEMRRFAGKQREIAFFDKNVDHSIEIFREETECAPIIFGPRAYYPYVLED